MIRMGETAIIFPGQGSQSVGMGKDVFQNDPHAAALFERANKVLGFDLATICFEGPESRLEETDIQQPAILVTSLAIWSVLTKGGQETPTFEAAAGLSLGEYTALHAAGALSFEDAVRLVRRRGEFMQESARAVSSGMVSIMGMEPADVETLCRECAQEAVLQPANFNCPGQIVISGEKAACERAVRAVESSGQGKAVMLKVAGAFHSELMRPAAEKLCVELDKTNFSESRVPVFANVNTEPHGRSAEIRELLYRQMTSAVRWQATIERLIRQGFDRFVEVGPGRVLTGLMRKIDRQVTAVNVSTWESLKNFMGG